MSVFAVGDVVRERHTGQLMMVVGHLSSSHKRRVLTRWCDKNAVLYDGVYRIAELERPRESLPPIIALGDSASDVIIRLVREEQHMKAVREAE